MKSRVCWVFGFAVYKKFLRGQGSVYLNKLSYQPLNKWIKLKGALFNLTEPFKETIHEKNRHNPRIFKQCKPLLYSKPFFILCRQ